MKSSDQLREEMLEVNRRQSEFYDQPHDQRGNPVTAAWSWVRDSIQAFRKELGLTRLIHERHLAWMGDLAGKRVLDFGCASGNALSLKIAARCGYYLAIDLSEEMIAEFTVKLDGAKIPHAEARAMDFLTANWDYEPFDVIYAHSVLHHFRYLDPLMELLRQRLAPGGVIVTLDPMETSLPIRILRRLYRPFQSDADWEFPFTRDTFATFARHFEIDGMQGVLGASKWAAPLAIVPFCRGLAARAGRKLADFDARHAVRPGYSLYACMHVALSMRHRSK